MQVSSINSIIKSKLNTVLSEAGAAEVQVTGVFYNAKLDRNTINFKAVTPYHVAEIKKLIKPFKSVLQGDQDAELDLSTSPELQRAVGMGLYTMSRTTDFTPAKGEYVKIQLGYITNKQGEQALVVTNISPLRAQKATKASLESLFEDDEEVDDFNKIEADPELETA